MNLKVTVRVSSWFLTVWPAHRAAITSALAVSGPAVRGSLPGTPMPLSTRIHVTRDTRLDGDRDHDPGPGPAARLARRRQPGPGYHSPSKIKSLAQAAGMGAGYQGLGATAVSACICLYHCHIVCMPYVYVCMCMYPQSFGGKIAKYEMSYRMYVACMLYHDSVVTVFKLPQYHVLVFKFRVRCRRVSGCRRSRWRGRCCTVTAAQ